MKLLAVETSTDACSAALFFDGEIVERFAVAPRDHTKLILPMIDELMADAELKPRQLDAVAVGRGPGSFTGVRIAGGLVQGIAFGADLPVVPVSTLAAIAQDFFNKQSLAELAFTAMDARMDEIYWAVYQRDTEHFAKLLGIEVVTPAGEVAFPEAVGFGVGSGWGVYCAQLAECLGELVQGVEVDVWPRAACIAQLGVRDFLKGLAVPVEEAMPVYLRDKVAKKESER
ncbi:tRNA (adenosine(37)-N6)-threonylcarbamoyltransferase complex dimerization subunit type 1 TsaB [Methylomonas sp. CM2]|uniref:tRNA (adenosine(37)-N6)-threonylcarbamoyltransferase complex dimerization subunit type 1 TsaB n=1 Tax=Methylomonas sp. CM2 TaxID=3417647 RepID=UPI003CEB7E1F